MSVAKERLIVNCGAASGRSDWNRALRTTDGAFDAGGR